MQKKVYECLVFIENVQCSLWGSSFSKYARDGADTSWEGYQEGVKLIFVISATFR